MQHVHSVQYPRIPTAERYVLVCKEVMVKTQISKSNVLLTVGLGQVRVILFDSKVFCVSLCCRQENTMYWKPLTRGFGRQHYHLCIFTQV